MANPANWSRVKEIFAAALDLEPAQRTAFLHEACGNDPALHAEVEALLSADGRAADLDGSPFSDLPTSAIETLGRGLHSGEQLGRYEVRSSIGAGGMGEVYEAHDTRLDRQVAIKILSVDRVLDPQARARFGREAHVIAALSHRHICTIYDVGQERGIDFLVMERLHGETLATRLRAGALPIAQALEIATEIAEALDAAHRAGIVHRDLKPGNIMLTRDGSKLLDFGLAKAPRAPHTDGVPAASDTPLTADGTLLGTTPYMAPEQLEGRDADARTDLFALGVVLYEMVTGRKAFTGSSRASVVAAILHTDPPSMVSPHGPVPAALERTIRKCLAKDPDARWQTARDLGDELKWLSTTPSSDAVPASAATRPRRRLGTAWALAAAVAGVLGGFALANVSRRADSAPVPPPRWQRLTFERGFVNAARFAPDRQTIVYSATWDGRPFALFTTSAASPESRALDLPSAGLLAISKSGELALSLDCAFIGASGTCAGTLARSPMLGGAPRALVEQVRSADWTADGELAVARLVGDSLRVELPPNIVLSERGAGHLRISPDGRRVAWTEAVSGQAGPHLVVRDERGTRRLSEGWTFISGLAWTPESDAVYLSGVDADNRDDLITRVSIDGVHRDVLSGTSRVRVLDAGTGGRLLVSRSDSRPTLTVRRDDDGWRPRDLTWLGDSILDALSDDGRLVLFTIRMSSSVEWSPQRYPIYVRRTDGGPATRLGTGYGVALSPDGNWALTRTRPKSGPADLVLIPLGPGNSRTLARGDVDTGQGNSRVSFAGPSRIVLRARRGTEPWRTYVQDIDGGPPARVDHEPGVIVSPVSPDGQRFVSRRDDGTHWIASIASGPARPLPASLTSDQQVAQWTEDGRALYILSWDGVEAAVTTLDLRTGRTALVRDVPPVSDVGFNPEWRRLAISRDGRLVARGDTNTTGALYVVDGIR